MGRISIDKPLIKELSELLDENNLSEISVTQGR
ncbi:MAG: acetyl-CoA carboxylase biotin carboxyl carrier protein, partial [Pelagibacterales bacterium]|nr:acetyl-CoA carboxylase biotin carboxyl carrier protein [Pelagibacterales bacterium]